MKSAKNHIMVKSGIYENIGYVGNEEMDRLTSAFIFVQMIFSFHLCALN